MSSINFSEYIFWFIFLEILNYLDILNYFIDYFLDLFSGFIFFGLKNFEPKTLFTIYLHRADHEVENRGVYEGVSGVEFDELRQHVEGDGPAWGAREAVRIAVALDGSDE